MVQLTVTTYIVLLLSLQGSRHPPALDRSSAAGGPGPGVHDGVAGPPSSADQAYASTTWTGDTGRPFTAAISGSA